MGYPPYPPPQYQQPYYPPQSSGVHPLVWAGLAFGLLFMFMIGGAALMVFALRGASAPSSYTRGGAYDDPNDDSVASGGDDPGAMAPNLPPPNRDVPVHDVKLLDGCSTTDLKMVQKRIDDAIDVGAPAYNGGDFLGCFVTYDDAAKEIEKRLPSSCRGPQRALEDGRKKARAKTTSADQAWAMRDAFDGLLDVIDRKGVDL